MSGVRRMRSGDGGDGGCGRDERLPRAVRWYADTTRCRDCRPTSRARDVVADALRHGDEVGQSNPAGIIAHDAPSGPDDGGAGGRSPARCVYNRGGNPDGCGGGGLNVPDDLERLLRFIVRNYNVREEVKDIERDASSVDDVPAELRRAAREEEQRAGQLLPAFREGLARADAARRAGGNAISLDDRDPLDNQIADALVHFLVRPGIALSSTRETQPLHYIYTIAVDWNQLVSVAHRARVDLDTAIRHSS